MLALSTPAQEILTNLLPNLLRKIRIPYSGVISDLNAMRTGVHMERAGSVLCNGLHIPAKI